MNTSDCLFCRIVRGEIPANIVHETDTTLAFRDIDPKAPVHVLIIPRQHIASVRDLEAEHASLVGDLFLAARAIATADGVAEDGYRLVMNTGPNAGQSVSHLHLHFLGGRAMHWPPG